MKKSKQQTILDHFMRLGRMHDFRVDIIDFEKEQAAISREFAGKREYSLCQLKRVKGSRTVSLEWLNVKGETI